MKKSMAQRKLETDYLLINPMYHHFGIHRLFYYCQNGAERYDVRILSASAKGIFI